jgi:hypothetical protein
MRWVMSQIVPRGEEDLVVLERAFDSQGIVFQDFPRLLHRLAQTEEKSIRKKFMCLAF